MIRIFLILFFPIFVFSQTKVVVRKEIQDYATVSSLRNATTVPTKNDKVFVKETESIYYYDSSDLTSNDDGLNVIKQGNYRWKTLKPGGILNDKVSIGIQQTGDYKPGAGIVHVEDNEGKYSEFTHYQYGTTIRTNNKIFEFFIGDTPSDFGTLSIRRNAAGNTAYGARLQVRDRDDIGGLELNSALLHTGISSLLVDYNYNGGIFEINNSQANGKIKLKCDGVESLIADKTQTLLNGKLGIGTSVPKSQLHILNSGIAINNLTGTLACFQNSTVNSNAYLAIAGAYNANAGIIFTDESEGYKGKILYNNSTEDLTVETNGATALKVKSGGEVQIYKSISFTNAKATDGSEVDNGNLFKGTDGALYFKGGSGTVTKIANP